MSKKKKNKTKLKTKPLRMSKKQQVIFGSFLFLLGIALLFSFTSYLFSWKADHSEIEAVAGNAKETQNWIRKFGSSVGHWHCFFPICHFAYKNRTKLLLWKR